MAGGATYLTDALGSTVAMADATGAIQTSYTYDPYGNTTVTGAASSNSQQFTGRENDGTSFLYFYRARYYFPSFGRFISEDPAGFAGGDTNLYRYVGNSPTNATDPSGQVAPIVGVLVVVCGFGAVTSAFETITRIFTPDMLGRRKTWNDVPKSAARGCVLNLMFFGVGTVASKILQRVTQVPRIPSAQPPPRPPGWSSRWELRPASRDIPEKHWWDPEGGEWRYHPPDKWHDPHWDYNPWDDWNTPWQHVDPDG